MLIQAIILLQCVFSIGNDFTAQQRRTVEDAHGFFVKITPENLAQLAPKVPEDVRTRIVPLFHTDPEFVKAVIEQEGPESDIFAKKDRALKALDKYDFKRLPNHGSNFIFELGAFDTEYIMKVSGLGNRRENLTAAHNMPYGSSYEVSPEFLDKFYPMNAHGQPLKTYQTASRVAHGLLFNQFLKECPACDRVKVVTEYLVTLPGKANQVDDKSCVVLSKKEHDIKPLTQEALQPVPVERVVCLWAGMRYAGGWNMNEDNVQINSKGELIWLDTEQPNSTQPHELFNRDYVRWHFNVTEEGERTLLNMLGRDSAHAKAIEEAKKQNVLESKEKFNNYIQQLKNKSNDNNNG
jgi:hypothetical protein